jgi:hypothetical protein
MVISQRSRQTYQFHRPMRCKRRGSSSLEVVLTMGVMLPLGVLLFFLAVKICSYVFSGMDGTLSTPMV